MFGVPSSDTLLMLNVRAGNLGAVQIQAEVLAAAEAGQVRAALQLRDAGELPAVDEAARDLVLASDFPIPPNRPR